MSQPAKSTMRAPNAPCNSNRGVRLPTGAPIRCHPCGAQCEIIHPTHELAASTQHGRGHRFGPRRRRASIVVQSMTNTDTADAEATAEQVTRWHALARSWSAHRQYAGSGRGGRAIRERLAERHHVPLIGDFHFNGHKLLRERPDCARALDKYRINPGNVGRGSKRDPQFAEMIEFACRYGRPVRIGVNWGCLDQDLLTRLMDENSAAAVPLPANTVMRNAVVLSALESARRAEELGLGHDRIILSAKVSGVQDLVAIYRDLAARATCAAPGPDRSGHGFQGHRRLDGRDGSVVDTRKNNLLKNIAS